MTQKKLQLNRETLRNLQKRQMKNLPILLFAILLWAYLFLPATETPKDILKPVASRPTAQVALKEPGKAEKRDSVSRNAVEVGVAGSAPEHAKLPAPKVKVASTPVMDVHGNTLVHGRVTVEGEACPGIEVMALLTFGEEDPDLPDQGLRTSLGVLAAKANEFGVLLDRQALSEGRLKIRRRVKFREMDKYPKEVALWKKHPRMALEQLAREMGLPQLAKAHDAIGNDRVFSVQTEDQGFYRVAIKEVPAEGRVVVRVRHPRQDVFGQKKAHTHPGGRLDLAFTRPRFQTYQMSFYSRAIGTDGQVYQQTLFPNLKAWQDNVEVPGGAIRAFQDFTSLPNLPTGPIGKRRGIPNYLWVKEGVTSITAHSPLAVEVCLQVASLRDGLRVEMPLSEMTCQIRLDTTPRDLKLKGMFTFTRKDSGRVLYSRDMSKLVLGGQDDEGLYSVQLTTHTHAENELPIAINKTWENVRVRQGAPIDLRLQVNKVVLDFCKVDETRLEKASSIQVRLIGRREQMRIVSARPDEDGCYTFYSDFPKGSKVQVVALVVSPDRTMVQLQGEIRIGHQDNRLVLEKAN